MSHKFSTAYIFLFHIFILLPFLAQSSILPQEEPNDLIKKTCKKTPHYDLCISSLESNPQSSNADLNGLAMIMVNIVLSNTTSTLDYIQALLKQAPEPQLQRALANCAELYIPVVKYSLPQAIEALIRGHFGFANFGISDAAKEADACEKAFSGSTKSPLTDMNSIVHDLSDIATAIINALQKD
ncbi:cell wall / vacuolar inhibitor of fructosidase 1-like [Ziziphus jujuba]|uniref:Cell wall / vacuolar inhibitor of fructosidase 1-like n=1 Tax=Ziziphus jujuba TaxID=326968 RepID=A0A6P3YTX9_ZIZJJ|nr:cell wall / vacuolar inhibitor of fructosidase 1-like [Ziziphus jujuba]